MMLLLLLACRTPTPPERLLDTGWFDDTGGCPHLLVATTPTSGQTAWYHRDGLEIRTTTSQSDRYVFTLDDGQGPISTTQTALADGNGFRLTPDAPLRPNTEHHLAVRDCLADHSIDFRTSRFGLPLTGTADGLADRVFLLDLPGASWLRPGGVAPLLALYFDAPVFFAVREAATGVLQPAITVGFYDSNGQPRQDLREPIAIVDPLPFDQAPYFEATLPRVTFNIGEQPLPIHGFRFAGTFSEDGSLLGGGRLEGLADTRNVGVLLSDPRPEAVCEFAEGLGVSCVPCPDGVPTCVDLEVVGIQGRHLPGFTLETP